MEWPKLGDSLFTSGTDWYFNACINSYHRDLGDVASCYKDAANTLVQAVIKEEALLDSTILPIVFLYRQYLELIMKGTIKCSRYILDHSLDYPKHHNLIELWNTSKILLLRIYGQNSPEMIAVDACINEFGMHDPDSIAFRYPTTKKGEPTLKQIKHINLRNLHETMERIASFFDCIYWDVLDKYQCTLEMEREYYNS